INAFRLERQDGGIAAGEIGGDAEFSRDARRRPQSVEMDVHAAYGETRPSGCYRPASPTAAEVNQDLACASCAIYASGRPPWNRVSRKLASGAPIEVAVRIHDPVVDELVDWTWSCPRRQRSHVQGLGFAPRFLGKYGDRSFDRNFVPRFADQVSIGAAQVCAMHGTAQQGDD